MIRIHRPNPPPSALTRLGVQQTDLDSAAYENNPIAYISHEKSPPPKRYYARKDVKNVLLKMHRNKCCYCERKRWDSTELHAEHFRPKGSVQQTRAHNKEYPGYYWLAYSWDNLLLACAPCNSTFKGALFPLENPGHRARSHKDDLSIECALFVNPA